MNVRKSFGQSVLAATIGLLAAASVQAQVSKDAPVPPVRAGDPPPNDPSQRAAIDVNDRQIMESMARGGIAEVEAGRIAEKNSSNPQVKAFAQTMVKDHDAANQKLEAIAARKGVKLPTKPDEQQQELLEESRSKQGPAFDETYVNEAALQDHLKAKQLFERAAKSAQDPDLRAFAKETLPVIDHHYQMAESLQRSLSKSAS